MAKILIVDDEEYIRQSLMEVLIAEGHAVATLSSGRHLLSIIDFLQPDVLILDIMLGNSHGLGLLQEIRHRYYDLPVILCSAYDSLKDDPRTMAADYFVTKSLDFSELKEKLNRVTGDKHVYPFDYRSGRLFAHQSEAMAQLS
ncbi:MAG: response regulator [Deltaproteobacteria bacterium]|nr:response regulator [Deltaproteobacteria bacterium]